MKILKKARSLIMLVAVLLCAAQQMVAQVHKPQVTAGEYFIDTDLGAGKNSALVAQDGKWGSALETAIKKGVNLKPGMHKIGIRVKDSLAWSPVFYSVISVENVMNISHDMTISAGELFWDKDPGQGKATTFLAFDGKFNSAIETALYKGNVSVSAGKHKLGVRVKDKQGNWGPVFYSVVSIEKPYSVGLNGLIAGQLFWDTDTAGAVTLIAADGKLSSAVETVLGSGVSSPTPGIHKLSIRVKDAHGVWGQAFSTIISIENKIAIRKVNVALAEAFVGNDPGEGNAIQLIAFDGNFNDAFERIKGKLPTDNLSEGVHKLGIRVKDASGAWGPVFSSLISVEHKLVARKMSIKKAEVFWDTDPGEGNGTPMLAIDGALDQAFEAARQTVNTAALGTGHHILAARVQDANGTWGPVSKTVIFIDECTSKPASAITVAGGKTTFCQGDSVKLTASAGTFRYRWVVGGKQLPDTTRDLYAKESGYYKAIVIDKNGCPGASAPTVINVTPLNPKIATSREPVLCKGEGVTLSVLNGFEAYKWSNGATSSYISTSESGLYKVTVTNKGCSRRDSIEVKVNPVPAEPIIINERPTTFCQGDSTYLLTSADFLKYSWSTGDTTKKVKIEKSGNYYVTVSNEFGCRAYSGTPVSISVINSKPYIYSVGNPVLCQGDSIKIYTTGNFSSYAWNTGDTTAFIYAKKGNTYTLTVTYNACMGYSNPFEVTVNPDVAKPLITASDTTTFCEGGKVTLTSDITSEIQWNTGASTASIDVKSSGMYHVTTRNQYGCAASSAPVYVNVLSLTPTISSSNETTFCVGDSTILSAGKGYSSYKWSNGATTERIKVTKSGTFSVTITNSLCGASEGISLPITVTVNPAMKKPVITQEGSLTMCSGQTLILTSSNANSYRWSNGSVSQSISITNAGTYFVKAFNEFGCSDTSASFNVNIYPQPEIPVLAASGPTTFCQGDSVMLTTTAAKDFMWNTGQKTSSIVIKESGDYFVNVISAQQCKAQSQAIPVTVTAVDPTVTASGVTSFCQGDSVVLSAPSEFSYLWSTGATSQSITAMTSDTYSVMVSKNGCQKSSNAIVVTAWLPPAIPVIEANDTTTFCSGDSVTLTTSLNSKYTWSNLKRTQSVVVYTSGNYSVTVEDVHGCSASSDDKQVTVLPTPPTPVITIMKGRHDFCEGDSVLLSSDDAFSYRWNTGDTTRQVWVKESGLYNLMVTNSSACPRESQNTQLVKHELPNPAITTNKPPIICQGDSVILSTNLASVYSWNTNDSTRNITAKTAGKYSVALVNEWGCINRDSLNVAVNPLPVASITHTGNTTICEGDSVILSAGKGVSLHYLWSTGDTSMIVKARQSGKYVVTVTDRNGCTDNETVAITVNPLPLASITSSAPTSFCQGDSVVLTASKGLSYLWSNGDTIQKTTVTSSGDYSVLLSNEFHCQARSLPTIVTVRPLPDPSISTSRSTTLCAGDSVILSGVKGLTYLWSNGLKTNSITAKSAGTIQLVVSNGFKCKDSSKVNITVNKRPGSTIRTDGDTVFCQGDSVKFTASTGKKFLWSTGDTTQMLTVKASKICNVVVTNEFGCESRSKTISVKVNTLPSPTIAVEGDPDICSGDSVILKAGVADAYAWSTKDTTSTIVVKNSGQYTVTVTNRNKCSARSSVVTIRRHALPLEPVLSQHLDTLFVTPDSSAVSYKWIKGTETVATTTETYRKTADSGSYRVTVIDQHGCQATSFPFTFLIKTGINDLGSAGSIRIYPNPSSGVVTFSTNGAIHDQATIEIYSVLAGDPIVSGKIAGGTFIFDASALSSGVYSYVIKVSNTIVDRGEISIIH